MPSPVGSTDWLPLVAGTELQPPEAAQVVAVGVAAQVSLVALPRVIDDDARVKVGGPGGTEATAASAWMKPAPES